MDGSLAEEMQRTFTKLYDMWKLLFVRVWVFSDMFFKNMDKEGWCVKFWCRYETPRVVTVRSCKIGVIYRIVQLCIISYVIGYVTADSTVSKVFSIYRKNCRC